MKYFETHSTDPYLNLAIEEYILAHKLDDTWLMLWQNDNTIVVGLNQNTEEEINRKYVDEHHVNVVRRMTGGGAVFHDLGNLNYSFITDVNDKANISIEYFSKPIREALKRIGIDAEISGKNDLLVDGKKISGVAQRICGERILHHGTLLFDSDIDSISQALRKDTAKFESKGVKSISKRVANIKDYLPKSCSIQEFWDSIRQELTATGYSDGKLTQEEYSQIMKLAESKYRTWEWNYGYSPSFNMTSKKRFLGGTLEVKAQIQSGLIEDINFYGDFMAVNGCEEAENNLEGVRFLEEDVRVVLDKLSIKKMFGDITIDEIISVIFH